MNSLIELHRPSQFVNILRKYKIILNETESGSIEDGGMYKINLEPGDYEIYLVIDWCRSNKLKISIKENETIRLKCGSELTGWRIFLGNYYIKHKKDKYLYIKQEE